MSEDNELTPELEALLRDIPAVDPSLREQHIAAALDEITPAAAASRLRFLAAAAAVVVLIGGGIAVARNTNDAPPAIAADTTVTSVPKATSECPHTGGFWGDVGGIDYFTLRDTAFELVRRDDLVGLYLGSEPCTMVGTISYYEAMLRRDKKGESPAKTNCEQKPLIQFSDNAGGSEFRLALLETSEGVSLFFEDRCNEPLGSIPLPSFSN